MIDVPISNEGKKGEISSIFQQLVFWKILMAFYSDV